MCEIILTILRNKGTRPVMVELLGAFLEANSRRSQIQVEEFKVSTDGFMLNLLNCLYELSIGKIPIDKVSLLKLLTI